MLLINGRTLFATTLKSLGAVNYNVSNFKIVNKTFFYIITEFKTFVKCCCAAFFGH